MRRDNEEYRTLKIVMERSKFEAIRKMLDDFKVDCGMPEMSDGRAIELILADLL